MDRQTYPAKRPVKLAQIAGAGAVACVMFAFATPAQAQSGPFGGAFNFLGVVFNGNGGGTNGGGGSGGVFYMGPGCEYLNSRRRPGAGQRIIYMNCRNESVNNPEAPPQQMANNAASSPSEPGKEHDYCHPSEGTLD